MKNIKPSSPGMKTGGMFTQRDNISRNPIKNFIGDESSTPLKHNIHHVRQESRSEIKIREQTMNIENESFKFTQYSASKSIGMALHKKLGHGQMAPITPLNETANAQQFAESIQLELDMLKNRKLTD